MKQLFLMTSSSLTETQYKRLKEQIETLWPKTAGRPILLEGNFRIKEYDIPEIIASFESNPLPRISDDTDEIPF